MPQRTIAVIDGNSLMHRAYHAVQSPMNTPDGTPTNAVFGFMSMLLKFIETTSPDGIVCAFDAGKPTFRIEAMAQYKATRPHMDDELRVQFPLAESLLAAMRIPVVKVAGWEGDDILGTVAARCEAAGDKALLVTGDKDACQLVTDLTHVVNTRKGISDVVVYDPAAVEERYGVTPAQIPDYLGLMGDASDNIPGVPGVGAKTAARLLQEYGSIEGLYEHADELKGKMGEKVRDNREAAFLSRKIATIVRDLDFELDLDAVKFPAFDADEVVKAFGALNFTKHLKTVLSLQGGAGGVSALADAGPQVRLSYHLARDAARYIADAVAAGSWVAIGLDEGDGSLFDSEAFLVASDGAGLARLPLDESWPVLERLLREGKTAGLNLKATVRAAARACAKTADELRPLLADATLPERLFDCGVAAYLLDSGHAKDAAEVVRAHLGLERPAGEDAPSPGCFETAAAAALVDGLRAALAAEAGAEDLFTRMEMPLVPVLLQMELDGAFVDAGVLERLSADVGARVEALRGGIVDLAGGDFNVDSPKQLGEVLFEKLGLDRRKSKKTQRGYSTSAAVLDKLRDEHPIAEKVIAYRELAKLKSTYLDALPALMDARDGRIHTTFNQTVTATGRLSSSDPNLQNIPVRTELGRHIREAFTAPEGCVFVSADYSQIELRLLAHLSGDAGLVAAFASGEDFHAHTAAQVFGVPVSEVTGQMRTRAKSVNFGIVYGQGAFGLSQNLHISVPEAQDMIDRYYAAYPQVRAYLDAVVADASEKGYAETMFGRRRHIPELESGSHQLRAFGERTAMNHPMQGGAADIIKKAMVEVQRRLAEGGFSARMVVQVHDELDFECPRAELDALVSMVKDAMEHVADLKVPLVVDVGSGASWVEAH